jgi:hypothetical protein
LKDTGLRYQPSPSGPRAADASIDGPDPSYFKENDRAPLTFPALSVQLPVTVAPAESGPPYVVDVQPLIPERPSDPENETPTGLVYHPPPSAPRAADALVTVGGVESFLIVTVVVTV